MGVDIARGNRATAYLKDAPCYSGEYVHRVSVIVPARNEERKIRAALQSVLRLDYPDLEFIVINDRSSDQTGAILAEIAAEDARLQVLTITELPAGWLGKNYALYEGAKRASGKLLLFTDADVVMEPSTLARAVTYLSANHLQHLAAMPAVHLPTLLSRFFCSAFGVFFSGYLRPWRAKDAATRSFIGIGAFNLVTADAYKQSGSHRMIAMRPDDDIKLGKLLKKAGYRQEMVFGMGLITVEWYSSLRELIAGLMKNAFAGLDYSVLMSISAGITVLLLNVWPFVAIFVARGLALILYVLAVIVMLLLISDANHFYELPRRYAFAHPLSAILFVYIIWKSMVLALWTRGIMWRGTHYPLRLLKANRL
ncbi:MAG TPA: glycosyltransferase [Terriglobales bacterium]|nr:glycosyltransferase [Terriglobales bacterium]